MIDPSFRYVAIKSGLTAGLSEMHKKTALSGGFQFEFPRRETQTVMSGLN